MRLIVYIFAFVTLWCSVCYGQISTAGIPISYSHSDVIDESSVMTIELNTPIINDLLAEDSGQGRSDAVWRDAVAVSVNAGLDDPDIGTWYDLGDMGSVWKLRIKAEGALSMEINFDQFILPEEARLYVYNVDHSEYIGAFTSINNKGFEGFSTHMIQSDDCIIEYYVPNSETEDPTLHIKDITYRYRDVLRLDSGGGAQECQIDVNCMDGDFWNNIKNSVVRIRLRSGNDFFWSTGVLMNNTASDCKPYILTSLRTMINPYTISQSSEEDFQHYKFYFGYDRSECNEGVGVNKSISGAFLRATSNDDGGANGSDFMLLELTENVPSSYDPYWSGWNVKSNPDVSSGVCIHHPMGDVKKISTFNATPTNADYGIENTHWKVFWDDSISGKGVTEIGSNGSPLFDEQGRVFGTLTAGGSSCEEVLPGGSSNPDYFGKMSKHWLENPNPIPQKLRSWLDPVGSGFETFDGSNEPCAVGIDEPGVSKVLEIWPNPASDYITVDFFNVNGKLTIYNVSGEIVLHFENLLQTPQKMDVSFLPQGLYFLQFSDDDRSFTSKKLVISR